MQDTLEALIVSLPSAIDAEWETQKGVIREADASRDVVREALKKQGGTIPPTGSAEGTPTESIAFDALRQAAEALTSATGNAHRVVLEKVAAIQSQETVMRQRLEALTPEGNEPKPAGYRRDENFKPSQLPEGERVFYEKALELIRYVFKHNKAVREADAEGNLMGRQNSSLYSQLCTAYAVTRDPEIVLFLAERMEVIVRFLQSPESINQKEVWLGRKWPQLAELKTEHWYDHDVTFKGIAGNTITTNWRDRPKMLYYRWDPNGADGRSHNDNSSAGTDLHTHDGVPRKAALVVVFDVLENNRDLAVPGMPIADMCDVFYDWLMEDMDFWEYRSTHSRHSPSPGLGKTRDGMRDWEKDIAHDVVQQLLLDHGLWRWCADRGDSKRAEYWEKSYRNRAARIEESCAYIECPNGHETVVFAHQFSWFRDHWRGKKNAWTSGGWFVRYDRDLYPAALLMAVQDAPVLGVRFARALANNVSQVEYISKTKISLGINGGPGTDEGGGGNRFADGSKMRYPEGSKLRLADTTNAYTMRDEWNKEHPDDKKRFIPSRGYYDWDELYVPDETPLHRAYIEQRFEVLMGLFITPFDPDEEHAAIKTIIRQVGWQYPEWLPEKVQEMKPKINVAQPAAAMNWFLCSALGKIDVRTLA